MPRPEQLKLLPEEQALLEQIIFDYHDPHFYQSLDRSCEAAGLLATSLLSRKAIPAVRLRWFTDPQLQLGTKMSRMQIFEKNGTSGDDILTHPHFLPYLRYFVFGPDLPADVIDQFSAKVDSLPFVSGSSCDELIDMARDATRRYGLSPHSACEEFWKLGLECGAEDMYARIIRDAVLKVRRR